MSERVPRSLRRLNLDSGCGVLYFADRDAHSRPALYQPPMRSARCVSAFCAAPRTIAADRRARMRPPAQTPRPAKREIGRSAVCAASSAYAFSMCRVVTNASCRVTDDAASQQLLAAKNESAASVGRFPARSAEGRQMDDRSVAIWPNAGTVPCRRTKYRKPRAGFISCE